MQRKFTPSFDFFFMGMFNIKKKKNISKLKCKNRDSKLNGNIYAS